MTNIVKIAMVKALEVNLNNLREEILYADLSKKLFADFTIVAVDNEEEAVASLKSNQVNMAFIDSEYITSGESLSTFSSDIFSGKIQIFGRIKTSSITDAALVYPKDINEASGAIINFMREANQRLLDRSYKIGQPV